MFLMFYHTKLATRTDFNDSSSEPGFWWFDTKRMFAKSIILGSWDHGFRWILEISWNPIARLWRVYSSRVVRGHFPLENTRFKGVWQSLNRFFHVCQHYLVGSVSTVVEICRCGPIHQNDQNWWKSSILMDFGDFMKFMKSRSAIMTGIPI